MMTKSPGSKRRMRRPVTTLLVLAAATALILSAVAGPAAAKRPDGAKLKVHPFVCKGEVTATMPAANSLTVKVVKGRKAVVGKAITFTLTGRAVIMKVGADGAEVISLGDVRIGDRVLVHGRVDLTTAGAPTYTAWLILDRGTAPPK